MRRVPGYMKALRFLGLIDPKDGTLSPRRLLIWVAVAGAAYSTIQGREAALLSSLTMIIGG
jgi:hypothetical protein